MIVSVLLFALLAWLVVDALALLLRAAARRLRLNLRIAPSVRGRDLALLCKGDTIIRAWRLPRWASWRSAAMRLP